MISLVDYTVLIVNRSIDIPSPSLISEGTTEYGAIHAGNGSDYSSGSDMSPNNISNLDDMASPPSAMGSSMKMAFRPHSRHRHNQSLPENIINALPRPRSHSISILHVEANGNNSSNDNDDDDDIISGDYPIPRGFAKFSQRRSSIASGHIPNVCLNPSNSASSTSADKGKSNGDHVRLIMNSCRHIAEATVQTINGDANVKDSKDAKINNDKSVVPSTLNSSESGSNGANNDDSLSAKSKRRRGGIIGFKELASKAGLSAWHFHRVFKSVTGITPKAYGDKCFEVAKQAMEDNNFSNNFIEPPISQSEDTGLDIIKQEDEDTFNVGFNFQNQQIQQRQQHDIEANSLIDRVSPAHFDTNTGNSVINPNLPVFHFDSYMAPSPNSLSSGVSASTTALADGFTMDDKSTVMSSNDVILPDSMVEDSDISKMLSPVLESGMPSFLGSGFTTESQLFDMNHPSVSNIHTSSVHASLFNSLNTQGNNGGARINSAPADETYSLTSSGSHIPQYMNDISDASSSLLGSYPSFTALSIDPISHISNEINDFEYMNMGMNMNMGVNMNGFGPLGSTETSDDIFAELTNLNGYQDSTNPPSALPSSAKLAESGMYSNNMTSVTPKLALSSSMIKSSPLESASALISSSALISASALTPTSGSSSSSSVSISTASPTSNHTFQTEKSTYNDGSNIFTTCVADTVHNNNSNGDGDNSNNSNINATGSDANGKNGSPVLISGFYDSNQYLLQPVAVPY